VGVVVNFLQAGLMQVRMSVFGSVIMGVRVLVLDMLVLMGRMGMAVRDGTVLMFMRVRRVVGVLLSHGDRLLASELSCADRVFQLLSAGARVPPCAATT
jgi:hypothetical protein